MITHNCDKCSKEIKQEKGQKAREPENWITIRPGGYGCQVAFELCPDCQKALNLPKESVPETLAERLIDILTEIAQDAVEQ